MGSTPATDVLAGAGAPHTVHRYRLGRDTGSPGAEAARALGVEPSRILKTLIAVADGALVVAVLPITSQLDLRALARSVGAKRAGMAEVGAAERSTGYVVGAISPIGQRRRLPTIVDVSTRGAPTVFVSGGRRGLELEIAPDDLVGVTGGRYAAIGRVGVDR